MPESNQAQCLASKRQRRRNSPEIPQVPTVPLPDHEPVPSDPDYADQRAGDLSVGAWGMQVLRERPKKMPPKKYPFGFTAPIKEVEDDNRSEEDST